MFIFLSSDVQSNGPRPALHTRSSSRQLRGTVFQTMIFSVHHHEHGITFTAKAQLFEVVLGLANRSNARCRKEETQTRSRNFEANILLCWRRAMRMEALCVMQANGSTRKKDEQFRAQGYLAHQNTPPPLQDHQRNTGRDLL